MRPRTLTTPKSMLEVAGRPFVDWQIEKLAACGVTDIVMCIAHLGEQIRDHVGDGSRYANANARDARNARNAGNAGNAPPLRVRYAEEGATLLGTAGALRNALTLLAPTFLVTYGDSYLPFDYAAPLRALAEHPDCDGVMSVFKNDSRWDTSNVVTDGEWVVRYDKAAATHPPAERAAFDHIDYGAIALRRDVVSALPPGQSRGLDEIQARLAKEKRLRACVARERFFEIGSEAGLLALDAHLRHAL